MNRKSFALTTLAASIVALCVLVVFVYDRRSPSSTDHNADPSHNEKVIDHQGAQGKSYSDLVKERKLDPDHVQPLGKRGFVISRSGDFRPKGDAKAYIQSLLGASNQGDSTATYSIYLAALDCRNAGSPSELQSATRMPSEPAKQQALESSESRLRECEELLKDPALSPPGKWLLEAAQQGSIEAMLLYATDTESAFGGATGAVRNPELVSEWKESAASFLNEAAKSGSIDALISLANANDNGIIMERNPTNAYAYYLAVRRAFPAAAPDELINRYKEELTSSQQQDAVRRAEKIYNDCCQ